MNSNEWKAEQERIKASFARARAEKPAYGALYPILEPLFLLQAEAMSTLRLPLPQLPLPTAQARWDEGFPLIRRWDFPMDIATAESILQKMKGLISENQPLTTAHAALTEALTRNSDRREGIWRSFLQHGGEPWGEWVEIGETDIASLLFVARSCLRPCIERTAGDLSAVHGQPRNWLKGYCPFCGSNPALLFLEGEGERKALCSWCGSIWDLHRLQCPVCDNRRHESLGYLYIEAEPRYRIQYCKLCRFYFKLVDTREQMERPCLGLEAWTTLHLDLLARREGWKEPPSPSSVVYGDIENMVDSVEGK